MALLSFSQIGKNHSKHYSLVCSYKSMTKVVLRFI